MQKYYYLPDLKGEVSINLEILAKISSRPLCFSAEVMKISGKLSHDSKRKDW
jgi:hypothetical protein